VTVTRVFQSVIAFLVLFTLMHPAQSASNWPSSSSSTCTPDGWSTPTLCMPVKQDPWQVTDNSTVPPGFTFPGAYRNNAEFAAALKSYYLGHGYCSADVDNFTGPRDTQFYVGLPQAQWWDYQIHLGSGTPCVSFLAATPNVLEMRDIRCEDSTNWALVKRNGAAICACRPNADCALPPKCPVSGSPSGSS